eukprot:CCRYP_018479-RB/>CCRYP_018479-RB protein AED:0.38 eAED:0.40 QI:0/0/0/1/0/0/2/0/196
MKERRGVIPPDPAVVVDHLHVSPPLPCQAYPGHLAAFGSTSNGRNNTTYYQEANSHHNNMSHGQASRRALYIGGLDTAVNETTLRAAFLPYGPIQHIDIPMDYQAGTHKGFAFLEFVDADDASEAIYNMDGAEIFGKALTVNVAQAEKMTLGSNKAVWSSEEWFKEQVGAKEEEERSQQEKGKERDAEMLKEKPVG